MDAPDTADRLQPTTASRQRVLDRLRTRTVQGPALPCPDPSRLVQFDDPLTHYRQMLEAVGGESHVVDSAAQISEILSGLPEYSGASRIASVVPEVPGNFDAADIDDPHDLKTLDWTIARGEFLVAENGAIWIEGRSLPHRVMLFIAQYLAIVVSRSEIVPHMHAAYQRIGSPEPGFGIFVSGPSKTADIEQSLVLGAHGCRKLQVFLMP